LLQTGIVQLVVAGRLDQCVLDHRLAHVVIQLALLAVVVNGVTAAAAAAAAAAVDATRLLCLDEHVTHSLQSESNDLVNVERDGPLISLRREFLSTTVFTYYSDKSISRIGT